MREALHRCDPPCIPYLGMYLTDLSFIEEGTPDFTADGLLNFSKMRMVSKHYLRNSLYTIFFSAFELDRMTLFIAFTRHGNKRSP